VFLFTDGAPTLDGVTDDSPDALAAANALAGLHLSCGTPRVVAIGIGEHVNHTFMRDVASSPDFYKQIKSVRELITLLPSIGTPSQVGGKAATVEGLEKGIRGEQNI
jgi:hypothetical protein